MEITDRIIEYINKNRVSTTEVADCLGKSGALPGVLPINSGKFCVGKISWIYAYNESNWSVHEQGRFIKENTVVLIDCFNCGERAIVGELVSKYFILYKNSKAMVVMGKMRDAHRLIKENYPIWCTGVSPIGCFNNKVEEPLEPIWETEHRSMYEGAIAVCDDSGVVIIPKEHINEAFLDKLESIEKQEDIWFDCIDRKKWDTFDTVCLKKYKEQE